MQKLRSISTHLLGTASRVGSFRVSRLFPSQSLDHIDPFLFLDFFDTKVKPGGFPSNAHPHRGFEAITVLFRGHVGYRDSLGNKGVLEPGSVEWMTAGSGIVHDSHGDHDFARSGGRVTGVQLWVNLPAAKKMIPPAARYLPPSTFPALSGDGWTGRLLAGEAFGERAPVDLHVTIRLIDLHIEPKRSVVIEARAEWSAFALVWDGKLTGHDGYPEVFAGQLVRYHANGNAFELEAGPKGARVLVGAGTRLREPIARGGPFVMNTPEEIEQAHKDYRSGAMGDL